MLHIIYNRSQNDQLSIDEPVDQVYDDFFFKIFLYITYILATDKLSATEKLCIQSIIKMN